MKGKILPYIKQHSEIKFFKIEIYSPQVPWEAEVVVNIPNIEGKVSPHQLFNHSAVIESSIKKSLAQKTSFVLEGQSFHKEKEFLMSSFLLILHAKLLTRAFFWPPLKSRFAWKAESCNPIVLFSPQGAFHSLFSYKYWQHHVKKQDKEVQAYHVWVFLFLDYFFRKQVKLSYCSLIDFVFCCTRTLLRKQSLANMSISLNLR